MLFLFSFQDALTDLTADCECLELPGKENTFAHKGMVLASKNIYTKLIDNQLLEQAFHKGQVLEQRFLFCELKICECKIIYFTLQIIELYRSR